MASSCGLALPCMALAFMLCVHGAHGKVTCEELDKSTCAFAVSSSGTRCLLEKHVRKRLEEYTCGSSDIEVEKLTDWIETDRCIEACGLDRNTLGISTDSLMESHFTQKLCSPPCYQNCPNIVDLYFNIAAGEGVFLPKLCESQGTDARRQMAEIKSSGIVAPGPESAAKDIMVAPAMSPL